MLESLASIVGAFIALLSCLIVVVAIIVLGVYPVIHSMCTSNTFVNTLKGTFEHKDTQEIGRVWLMIIGFLSVTHTFINLIMEIWCK